MIREIIQAPDDRLTVPSALVIRLTSDLLELANDLNDTRRRQVWGRIKRQWRRFGPEPGYDPIGGRLWAALKRQAINRAVGIG